LFAAIGKWGRRLGWHGRELATLSFRKPGDVGLVLRTRLRGEHPGNVPWLFFLAALAIPAFYAVGLIARTGNHLTVTEFWRFWVVHLWVEDFLELFTTVMVAYMFVLLGVVREKVALAVILLDISLYSAGGIIGTIITCTSPANRRSTWRSGRSSRPPR
jgi:hypothetical protein